MKKKELTEEILINWWLEKYHNTNLAKVKELHPDWGEGNLDYSSRMFYEAYQVTEEQHGEWRKWAFETVKKHFRMNKDRAERSFAWTYLNTAPMVKPTKVKL